MYFEQALQRISDQLTISNLKFIFVFRNPAERAYSHYLMTYRRGMEKLPFEQAINAEAERIQKDYVSRMHYSYVDRGYYARQVNRFLAHVDKSQMLFLLSDELNANPQLVLSRIFRFLGVDPDFDVEGAGERFHQATTPRSMGLVDWLRNDGLPKRLLKALLPVAGIRKKIREKILSWNQKEAVHSDLDPAVRKRLMELYAKDIAELAAITRLDLSVWIDKPAHEPRPTVN